MSDSGSKIDEADQELMGTQKLENGIIPSLERGVDEEDQAADESDAHTERDDFGSQLIEEHKGESTMPRNYPRLI